MGKNWKIEFLKNLGAILLSGLFVVVGFYLTKDLQIQPTPEGHAIEFGGNALLQIVAPSIPGLLCIFFIYREIKLLIQLFSNGGPKVKIGCILSVIIPVTLCAILFVIIISGDNEQARLGYPTSTAFAKRLYSDKGNGTYKIGTDIGSGRWYYMGKLEDCHWTIIAHDGQEADKSRRVILFDIKTVIDLEPDDQEFRNIDCGVIKYDPSYK